MYSESKEGAQFITLTLFSKNLPESPSHLQIFLTLALFLQMLKFHLCTKFSVALDQIIVKSDNSVYNSQHYNLKKKISRKDH